MTTEELLSRVQNHIAQMAPHQSQRHAGKLIIECHAHIARLMAEIRRVANECNCRAEHGVEGAEHLRAIEQLLRAIA